MPVTEISQLDKAGVITDINQFLLAPEAFSEAYNVDFSNGSVSTAKGYYKHQLGILPENESWKATKGIADKLYLFSDKQLYITNQDSAATMAYPEGFTVSKEFYINALSNLPVFISNKVPYGTRSKLGVGEIFKLDGWGNNMTARSVVSYKGYLFAFGVTVDSLLYEDTVFWSDVAAPDTYPTDWGFALDAQGNINLASPIKGSMGGFNQLSAVGGSLVAAATFADSLYLFTESEVFRVTEIGGTQIFRFQKVSTGKGATSPNSVIALENGLAVIGANELYLFNGQSSTTLSEGRIGKYLSSKLLNGVDIKMIRDFNEKQLYIFFKNTVNTQAGDLYPYTDCVVWDWVSNNYSFRDSNYCQFTDITEFRADSLLGEHNKDWSDMNIPWSQGVMSWQSEVRYGTGVLPIRDKDVFIMNRGYKITPVSDDTEQDIPWSLSRKFYTNVLGYSEAAIVRVLTVRLRGHEGSNVRISLNGTLARMKLDTGYLRITDKVFDLQLFGSGYMSIPAYAIEHSLIGNR